MKSLELVNVTLFGKLILCRYNLVKDLEMRASWITQVWTKSHHQRQRRRQWGDMGGE